MNWQRTYKLKSKFSSLTIHWYLIFAIKTYSLNSIFISFPPQFCFSFDLYKFAHPENRTGGRGSYSRNDPGVWLINSDTPRSVAYAPPWAMNSGVWFQFLLFLIAEVFSRIISFQEKIRCKTVPWGSPKWYHQIWKKHFNQIIDVKKSKIVFQFNDVKSH